LVLTISSYEESNHAFDILHPLAHSPQEVSHFSS